MWLFGLFVHLKFLLTLSITIFCAISRYGITDVFNHWFSSYLSSRNLFYRKYSEIFQEKMDEDVIKINDSNRLLIFADKTTNIYSLSPEEHIKLLNDNVTKTYKQEGPAETRVCNQFGGLTHRKFLRYRQES